MPSDEVKESQSRRVFSCKSGQKLCHLSARRMDRHRPLTSTLIFFLFFSLSRIEETPPPALPFARGRPGGARLRRRGEVPIGSAGSLTQAKRVTHLEARGSAGFA